MIKLNDLGKTYTTNNMLTIGIEHLSYNVKESCYFNGEFEEFYIENY